MSDLGKTARTQKWFYCLPAIRWQISANASRLPIAILNLLTLKRAKNKNAKINKLDPKEDVVTKAHAVIPWQEARKGSPER